MPNTFLNIGMIGGAKKRGVGPKPKLSSPLEQEIAVQNPRLSGVTKKLTRAYANPARLLPKSHSLKMLGTGKK